MQRTEVMNALSDYIVNQILDGKNIGLDEATPLLEWGVINSMEMIRLLNFIAQRFGIDIPAEKMIADHFTNLASITDLVLGVAGSSEQQVTRVDAGF
jgi:acyl carrier protein